MAPDEIHFQETQRFRQWWIQALVMGVAFLAWWGFVQQVILGTPFGNEPAPDLVLWVILLLAGIGLPWIMIGARLFTVVRADHLDLHYRPFRRRRIDAREILDLEAVTFRPIRDWGGWGFRWRKGRGWAWTVSGNQGVRLDLTQGRTLTVGSQEPHALEAALRILAEAKPRG